MISDEPDEDADSLDDESLLATYAGMTPPKPELGSQNAAAVLEWPRLSDAPTEPYIDATTLAWFKANHTDWQEEVRLVLRTWVAVHTQPLQDPGYPTAEKRESHRDHDPSGESDTSNQKRSIALL